MNREIKFRAWDKEKKIMWESVSDIDTDLELMQYTGLKDKNGTEIYEGDIVKGEYNGIVLYSNEMAMFAIVTRGDWESWIGFEDTSIYSIEIIGNIYTNPEALQNQSGEGVEKK